MLVSLMALLALLLPPARSQTDTSTAYHSSLATASVVHHPSSTIYLANTLLQVQSFATLSPGALSTLSTAHKARITALAVSPDNSMLITGGSDYTARVYALGNSSVVCLFEELRGEIVSARFGSDNNMYALGSNEGFLYYGYVSNCSKQVYKKLDFPFVGALVISSRSEVWAADNNNNIVIVNYASNSVSTISLPTSRVHSVLDMTSQSLVGVCTSRAFYILNYAGAIQYTQNYPTTHTRRCRLAPAWSGSATQFVLTAVPESRRYERTGSTFVFSLYTVWKVDTSGTMKVSLYHDQRNTGNRYGASGIVLEEAVAVMVDSRRIMVATLAQGYSALLNTYQDNLLPGCATGYFSNLGFCEKCAWDTTNRQTCATCNSLGQCQSCMVTTYYVSATRKCLPCPSNCFECTSATVCTACSSGFSLVGSNCLAGNITGCIVADWQSPVSYCLECESNYLAEQSLTCKTCTLMFSNCSSCNSTACLKCDPNFLIADPSTNNCELCEIWVQGCAGCINQTYCDVCYEEYPYFDYPSANTRICKKTCHQACLTCTRNYATCLTCDSNRTLVNSTCQCKPGYPITDTTTSQCRQCRDYLPHCSDCTNTSYCITCDAGYYYDTFNASIRQCKTCNYSCLTCDTNWSKCDTCDAAANRVLNASTNLCICAGPEYLEIANQIACSLCADLMTNCKICVNSTFCQVCATGFYLKSTGTGTNMCDACQAPCTQCIGTASNCTDCAAGRQLNTTTRTCDCLLGYYATGATACAQCSPILGSCQSCNNDTVCLQCFPNNYFQNVSGKRKCNLCQSTCLTCSTYANQCATCQPLLSRTLNAVTHQCDCMTGFVETSGRCLNCSALIEYCNSCNLTHCLSCDPGYSLAYNGMKCQQCQLTYPGCLQCLNGLCAQCNASAGYVLGYSKCVCSRGRYMKNGACVGYAMGGVIGRGFLGYGSYRQDMSTGEVTIQVYWRCEGLLLPYGILNAVELRLNGQLVSPYTVTQSNTTLYFKFTPKQAHPQGNLTLEFLPNKLYDLSQYSPSIRTFTFVQPIYLDTNYQLSPLLGQYYQSHILPIIRYIFTIATVLSSPDVCLILIYTTQILPSFLMLDLSIPPSLRDVLQVMMGVHGSGMVVVPQLAVEQGQDWAGVVQLWGAAGLRAKVTDLVVMAGVLGLYGVVLPALVGRLPEGRFRAKLEDKLIRKRYSNLVGTVLIYTLTFLTCSVVDLKLASFDPSLYLTIGSAFILVVLGTSLPYPHAGALALTQLDQHYHNEDSYMGSSPLQPASLSYVLTSLVITMWFIPLLGYVPGVYCLPIMLLVLVIHLGCYRNWHHFPNKFMYFLRIFYALFLVGYVAAFLVFQLAQKYLLVQVSALKLIGLCTLVNIIILLSISTLEFVFLTLLSLYRLCRPSTIANLVPKQYEAEPQSQSQSQSQEVSQYMRATSKSKARTVVSKFDSGKEEHMRRFRQEQQSAGTRDQFASTRNQFASTRQQFATTKNQLTSNRGIYQESRSEMGDKSSMGATKMTSWSKRKL